MIQVPMLVPPPDNWQDFERLTFSTCKAVWPDDDVVRHGRHGQAQLGVDIYCYRHYAQEYTGLQCKRRNPTDDFGDRKVGGQLTIKEVKDEIQKAESFRPTLKQFIIATTASTEAWPG